MSKFLTMLMLVCVSLCTFLSGMDSSSESDDSSLSEQSACSIMNDDQDVEAQQLSVMSQPTHRASVQTYMQRFMQVYINHISKHSTKVLSISTACLLALTGGAFIYLQYYNNESSL